MNANSDRGQGTVDLIEFFQGVAQECAPEFAKHAEMCIVSGRTHILFTEKYRLCENEDGREFIAFNKTNDLNKPPDPKHISHLGEMRFPGTMIGIRFPLTSDLTEDAEFEG